MKAGLSVQSLGTFLKVGGESDRGHPLVLAVSEVTKGARVKSNEVCKRGIKELRGKETTEGTKNDEGCEGGPRRARAKLENGRNGVGRKCADIFFIDVCNCVKMRDLTCGKIGRKYCEKIEIMFVIQKNFVSLQPIN